MVGFPPCIQAQVSPVAIGAALQVMRDSNVLRTASDQAVSDTITALGVRATVDQPIGREKLHLLAAFDSNRFDSMSSLNNNSYSVLANLDWAAIANLSGAVGGETSNQLNRYDQALSGRFAGLNMERNARLYARARVGMVTKWTLESGVEATQRQDSADLLKYRNQRRQSVDAGVRFQPSPELSAKMLVRYATGQYPNLGTGDDYHRSDLESSASWQATGASLLDGRLTWSRERHSLLTSRSSNQWSGTLGWGWQASGKLQTAVRLTRDSDSGGNAVGSGELSSQYADATVRTTLATSATWDATSKIQLKLGLNYSVRDLDSALLNLGTERFATDHVRSLSVAATYKAMRELDLGCNLSSERRTVTGDAAGLTFPLEATVLGCFGQLWWR